MVASHGTVDVRRDAAARVARSPGSRARHTRRRARAAGCGCDVRSRRRHRQRDCAASRAVRVRARVRRRRGRVGDAVRTTTVGQRVVVPFQINCGSLRPVHTRPRPRAAREFRSWRHTDLAPLSREYGGALSDLVEVPFADAHARSAARPASIPRPLPAQATTSPTAGARSHPSSKQRPAHRCSCSAAPEAAVSGLYAAAVAVALGSERVDYVDEDPARLAVAERIGANALPGPIEKRYGPYPITVNHTTEPSGLTAALRSTEPGGTCTSTTDLLRQRHHHPDARDVHDAA